VQPSKLKSSKPVKVKAEDRSISPQRSARPVRTPVRKAQPVRAGVKNRCLGKGMLIEASDQPRVDQTKLFRTPKGPKRLLVTIHEVDSQRSTKVDKVTRIGKRVHGQGVTVRGTKWYCDQRWLSWCCSCYSEQESFANDPPSVATLLGTADHVLLYILDVCRTKPDLEACQRMFRKVGSNFVLVSTPAGVVVRDMCRVQCSANRKPCCHQIAAIMKKTVRGVR